MMQGSTLVLILIAGVCVLGEQVRPLHVAGTLLIFVGVACLLSGN